MGGGVDLALGMRGCGIEGRRNDRVGVEGRGRGRGGEGGEG